MDIAIIFAMDEELKAFLNLHGSYETEPFKGRTLYTLKSNQKTILAIKSGIGKTHSAYVATMLLHHKKPDLLLNVGVAGGLSVPLGTLVVGAKSAYHDVDVTAFNYPYGQIPGAPAVFDADPELVTSVRRALKSTGYDYHEGTILTGDHFVQERTRIGKALEIHPDALAVDMEAASIAHVAMLESVPFLSIRTISDELDTDIQMDTYELEMERSAIQAAKTVKALIERL